MALKGELMILLDLVNPHMINNSACMLIIVARKDGEIPAILQLTVVPVCKHLSGGESICKAMETDSALHLSIII
jgi:hypothetical protein